MDAGHLVTQSNDLIEARYKHPLSAREQKIILTMVSMIQPNDEDFLTYDISIRDFHEMLGLEGREKYTEIKQITEDLMSKVIEIPKKDGGWLLTHWVSVAQYVAGEGTIQLKFVPELKPYLLQLKKAFTSYRLSNILSLKSAYSIRLYELMKKWQHLARWECSVENLREKVGVKQGKYPQYANFKQRVLTPSVTELNKRTDIQVDFKEIRKGRKVIKIEFTIKHCKEKELKIATPKKIENELDQALFDVLNNLSDFKLSLKGFVRVEEIAKKIYKDDYIKQLKLLVEIINLKMKQTNVDNPMGLMIYVIEDKEELFNRGYDPSIEKTSSEVIPEWFKERKKPQKKEEKSLEELEKEQKETEEIANLLKRYSNNND